MTSSRMPALFLGHGSPMNVLEDNVYTRAWREAGRDAAASESDCGGIRALVHPRHGRDRHGGAKDHS